VTSTSDGLFQSKDDEDTEAEEEDESKLIQFEELLLKYDDNFHPEDVLDVQKTADNSVLYRFHHGAHNFDAEDLAQQHQLHVNVERVKVPEVLLQPTIAGLDHSGVVGVILEILKHFSPEQQQLMIKVY
jgi:actin-related protein 5